MPELPEIETVKIQLHKRLVGQTLVSVEALHPKSVEGNLSLVKGKKIIGVKRYGKMLLVNIEGDLGIAIHFKMTGELVLVRSSQIAVRSKNSISDRIAGGHPTTDWVSELPSKHTRAIFHFVSGDTMYFNDQRIFGWVKIMRDEEVEKLPFIEKLGPEPWNMTDEAFYSRFKHRKRAVKLVLMDQELLSGIGNIYANDGLWEAKIHPATSAQTISQKQAAVLKEAIIKVLEEGIKYGGASAADAKYVNLDGLGGTYQKHFRVYDREGNKCLRRDGGIIKKYTLGGRGTYYCPVCQKKPKTVRTH